MANPVPLNPETRARAEGHTSAKWFSPRCQEKPRREILVRPYRKPTQVGRHKRAKAREITLVKELGNLAP